MDKNLPSPFQDQKHRVACVRVVAQKYNAHYNEDLVRRIIQDGSPEKLAIRKNTSVWQRLNPFGSSGPDVSDTDIKSDVMQLCDSLSDQEFLANIDAYVKDEALVEPATRRAVELAYDHLTSTLSKASGLLMKDLLRKYRDATTARATEQINAYRLDGLKRSADLFIQQINSIPIVGSDRYVMHSWTRLQILIYFRKFQVPLP